MAIKTIDVQFGLSGTTSNNFVLRTPDDGTLRFSRGVLGTTNDIISVDRYNNFIINNGVIELANVVATAPTAGVNNYNVISNGFVYHTANNATNFTLNIIGPNLISVGQVMTLTVALTNNANAYYPNVITVDGSNSGVSTRWLSSAPTGGNASSIDLYSFSIVKTGNATVTVFASQAKYA